MRARPEAESSIALLWIVLLTAASALTTWALACGTPFAALAALAAVHMRRQDGIMLVVVAWLISQVLGFTLLGYPQDAGTIAWGFGIGAAAVGSALAARWTPVRRFDLPKAAALAVRFVAAFVGYSAVLALFASVLGGLHVTLDPINLAGQFARDGAILIGLAAFARCLLTLGVPALVERKVVA